MANKNLNSAKVAKKDEFYTQMPDIERELQHYWEHFRGKTILCNCDDPYESNFFKYFALRFNQLGLKKLICTCYNGSPVQGNELVFRFAPYDDEPEQKIAHKLVITEVPDANGDGAVDLSDVRYLLENDKNVLSTLQTGDFRSPECIELLKEADIVVTNPPFSLIREYIAQLIQYDKKFVILARTSMVHAYEIFPYFMEGKMWIGAGYNLSLIYKSPYDNTEDKNRKYVQAKGYNPDEYIKVPAIGWFTNLKYKRVKNGLDLVCRYNDEDYPKYVTYDAIDVDEVGKIPCDYDGIMGVPDTFIQYFDPEQFELIGAETGEFAEKLGIRPIGEEWIRKYREAGGTGHYTANMKSLVIYDRNGKPKKVFSRILIRNKHPKAL
ncbi:MAG: adenine-specific methyltransferase EcoRI family protein [Bacteroidaceae bacterium]|nr:adenine-specific methyltransferase EcoRI family protein [Bacteroidaceae bacterium]